MKYLFRFFVLAVLAAVALTSRAQEVKITGYQPGEFAVKNGVEQQLNINVVRPITSAMTRATGGDLRIFVTGYADKTGSGAENDRIALARAEQAKEFLSEQFPKATITDLTKGDDDKPNARMVTISWRITPATPMQHEQKKSNSGMIVLVAILGIVVIIIISIAAHPKATPSVQSVPTPQAVETILVVAKSVTSEMVSVEKDGNIYDVPIELKYGMWHTPFPTQTDAAKIVFRKDRRDAVKAIKACVANPFYAPTIKQLIANGTITVRKGVVS